MGENVWKGGVGSKIGMGGKKDIRKMVCDGKSYL